MDLGIGKVEDSYSRACKNRMEAMLDDYINSLEMLASLDTLKNILYGVRVVVDYRNRHLTDFAAVNLEDDPKARFFSVSVSRKDIVRDVRRVMRSAGFDEMQFDEDNMTLWIIIKRPTFDQRNELLLEANRFERSTRQAVANVKRDTMERLRAAVDREYIEEVDIKPTMEMIEVLYAKTIEHVTLITIRRKQQIMGSFFVFDSKEDEELWTMDDVSIYKRLFKVHDIDYAEKPVLPVKIAPKKKAEKPEKVKQIIYVSKPTDFNNGVLKHILRSAMTKNAPLKVTGCLICRADFYLQFLEGPKEAIDVLYEKILVDKRHTDIKRLRGKNVNGRLFGSWAMKYDFNKNWMWSPDQIQKGVLHKLKADEALSVFEKLAAKDEAKKKEAEDEKARSDAKKKLATQKATAKVAS